MLNRPDLLPSQVVNQSYLNPQTGPFTIDGAEPGDTLAIHFRSIEPHYDYGVSANMPYFGSLTSTPDTATLQDPLPEKTWYYPIDKANRTVTYRALDSEEERTFPLDPMHGTVGVAPGLGEVRTSLAPGPWGGNMDTPEMRTGVTCYVGVNVSGAGFSVGDGHARQGEGEACGTAVECAMDSVIILDLIKGVVTPWPRIESDDFIITTGSAKPMEDAFRIAHTQMVFWIQEILGLSKMDAYQLIAQVATTPVAQAVDSVYTITCKVPKSYLEGVQVYDGLHEKLRDAEIA